MFLAAASWTGPGQTGNVEDDSPSGQRSAVAAPPAQPVPAPSCGITVMALTGLPGRPAVTTRSPASRFACGGLPGAAQPGGARPLEPGAFALSSSPVYRDGQLWFASSFGHDFGGGPVDTIRWGQLDLRKWPRQVKVVQESIFGTADASSFCPALMVNGAGRLVVAYARSSPTEFPSVYYTGRDRADPAGTLRAPTLLKAGSAAVSLYPDSRNRYGDYFAAAPDPADGTVWVLGEYGQRGNQAGLWLGHIL